MKRLAPLLLVAAAAGCGGGAGGSTTRPELPRPLAQAWARRADLIAAAAAAGDDCRALQLATSLRQDVLAARSRLPRPYRATLVSSVEGLADGLTCAPAEPSDHGDGKDKGRGKKHGHDKGHGKGGD